MALNITVTRRSAGSSEDVFTDAGVLNLTGQVNALLQLSIPEATLVDSVKNCLERDYGAANVELRSGIVYRYFYDPELDEWVQVCIQSNRFSVDDGGETPLALDIAIQRPAQAAQAA